MLRPPPRLRLLLGLSLALLAPSCGPGKDPRPNVLLISIDTLRADHLSAYGYSRETSPGLDRLAAGGALFERAVAPTSWTLPSHISMLTGLEISAHGIADDRQWSALDGYGQPVSPRLSGIFISELLRDAGYRTAGFHTWKYLERQFGFGPGFEVYERLGHTFYSHPQVSRRFEALRVAGDVEGMRRLRDQHPELFDATRKTTPEVLERARRWITQTRRETPKRPFFCFLHLFDVHDPYVPPPPYDTLFDPDYEGPINGGNVTSAGSPVRIDMDPRDLEHLIALYDGEIAYVDAQLAGLFDWLAQEGLAENTIVVVTSDHGEEFFEHGHKTHRRQLYRESVHVPWILSWPGRVPSGLRIAQTAGLIDMTPTLLGLVGVGLPPWTSGRDLSAVVLGLEQHVERPYLTELYLFDTGPTVQRQLGLHRGAFHDLLIADGHGPFTHEQFDYEVNPLGLGPGTWHEPGSPDWQRATEDLAAQLELIRAIRAQAPSRTVGPPGGLSARDLAELSAVGYVHGVDERKLPAAASEGALLPAEAGFWEEEQQKER
jgi:arylsulfatase A-like enzyme